MGGHGGLNILPQKRWNVYNRDNRLKVARDEEKQRQLEEESKRKHEAAEREFRRTQLLRQARGGAEAEDVEEKVASGVEVAGATPLPPIVEHINFWKEDEAKLQHPDRVKEKVDELRKRGNPDTFTSDAKFDERFQLGYGLLKEVPWYAQRIKLEEPPMAGENQSAPATTNSLAIPGITFVAGGARGPSQSDSASSSDSSASGESSRRRKRRRKSSSKEKKRKEKQKKKKEKKAKRDHGGAAAGHAVRTAQITSTSSADANSIEALRMERLRREDQERQRAKDLLLATYECPAGGKKYHNAFGFAAELKRAKGGT